MQIDYSPSYLVEFQLKDPTGLNNALFAPFGSFERGGLVKGTGFREFNIPDLRGSNLLNPSFRELIGP